MIEKTPEEIKDILEKEIEFGLEKGENVKDFWDKKDDEEKKQLLLKKLFYVDIIKFWDLIN